MGAVDIRAERRAAGLSQSQLASAAGVRQTNLSAYENGRRSPSPQVLDRIKRALVVEHHALAPRIFGSVARGDDQPGSDLDLLVEFTDDASLLDEIGLRVALDDLLRVDVDVVASDSLNTQIRERILREAVQVRPTRPARPSTRLNACSLSAMPLPV